MSSSVTRPTTRFACPNCKTILQAQAEQAGTIIACPQCKNQMKVPASQVQAFVPATNTPPPLPAPAAAELAEWYYMQNSQQVGPVSWQRLRQLAASQQLRRTDMVWKSGMSGWTASSSIQNLFPPRPASAPSPAPPAGYDRKSQTPLSESAKSTTDVSPRTRPAKRTTSPVNGLVEKGKKVPLWVWLVGIPLGSIFLCCGGCGMLAMIGSAKDGIGSNRIASPSGGGSASSKAADVKVSAIQLMSDYKANEVGADQKYKGKTLEVSGTVDKIGKDILDNIYVTLKGGERYSIFSVQCFFDDKYTDRAAKLAPGQQITIRGRCDGKFGNVMVKDSELVD